MSDLDDKLIIEAMSRRGFLGTLGKAAATAGLNPKLPAGLSPIGLSPQLPIHVPDDNDHNDDYFDDYFENIEFSEFEDWIKENVLNEVIDSALGDLDISDFFYEIFKKIVLDIIRSGDDYPLTTEIMKIFKSHMKYFSDETGKEGKELFEDSRAVEFLINNLREEIHKQLNLKEIVANAAAREQRGDKQEDILKDVESDLDYPIEYSKFDTAGGKKDYEYTADSYVMSNKDNKMLSEAYLNEIAFTKNVNYNDEDRVKDTLHDIADRKDKKKWKFDPLDPESEDGYYEEGEESLKKVIDKTFALNLPGLDELNEDIAHLDMFVSYDRKVFKLLKITGLNQYRVMGTYSDPTELKRDIRSIQLENL